MPSIQIAPNYDSVYDKLLYIWKAHRNFTAFSKSKEMYIILDDFPKEQHL